MKLEAKIIKLLETNQYKTYKAKELSRRLKIPSAEYQPFRKLLKQLVAENKIFRYKKNRYGLGKRDREIIGTLQVKTQGYAFLIRDDSDDDIFISHLNMGTAFDGDIVKVSLFAETKGRSQEAKVTDIIKRHREQFVGIYQASKYWGFVEIDNKKIHRDIYVPREKSKHAKSGQKVVVVLDNWEDERVNPEGEIIEILGFPDEPGVDIISIIKSHNLETSFSPNILNELDNISNEISADEIKRRLDLRDEICFTIDPEDSKDFDDAVSLSVLDNGHYLLGVHIADVSYYVKEDTEIDKAALERGTSIYLVDRVIPMLPEKLSNELCSLKPDQDRLCFSALMEISESGEVVDYKIRETIIHSKKRFTYQDVQEIIEKPGINENFGPIIQNMFQLNQKLITKRSERGGLDFSTTEAKIILDNNGKPVDIKPVIQLDSHRIIEEFMILANKTVAAHISVKLKQETGKVLPFAYRIHEKPNDDKLKTFTTFISALGYASSIKKRVTPKVFKQMLAQITEPEVVKLVEDVLIRTMMKAKYDTKNVGHFGLALKHYCHFTSPIRRYPDLICHRLLKQYLTAPLDHSISNNKIKQICEIATNREIAALEAERASIKSKQLEFMEQFVGEEFHGIISGVVAFGLFVKINRYLVEGLVHITNLPDDYYIHDEVRYCLYGQYNSKEYHLGDKVKIQITKVNRSAQLIDFVLVED